jgi:hypothetical protein
MLKINQSFFIKILLEVIRELKYDTIKSVILIYSYIKIVYDIISIYNLKFKNLTNPNINKTKYIWIKTFFYDDKFYDDLILFINANLIIEINKYIYSTIIDNFILNYLNKNILISKDYINFMKFNSKTTNEIIIIIHSMCENIFKYHFNIYLSNIDKNTNIQYNIFESNDLFIKSSNIDYYEQYLRTEYEKINKTQELIEILNLSNNVKSEQMDFNLSCIKFINYFGIIGFWNFVLYLCYLSQQTNTNEKISSLKELETFYKLNLYLFNGVFTSYYLKNIFKNISPYESLGINILQSSWFVKNNTSIEYYNVYDYPSEINLLSSIALNIIVSTNINIQDIKIEYEVGCNNKLDNYTSIFNLNNGYFTFNYVDWNSLFESITHSYLNTLQFYLTSHHIGRKIGINIINILDKLFK